MMISTLEHAMIVQENKKLKEIIKNELPDIDITTYKPKENIEDENN